jgi:hypothetical protein
MTFRGEGREEPEAEEEVRGRRCEAEEGEVAEDGVRARRSTTTTVPAVEFDVPFPFVLLIALTLDLLPRLPPKPDGWGADLLNVLDPSSPFLKSSPSLVLLPLDAPPPPPRVIQ